MTPVPVTRDAPTLADVLAAVGWRRAPRIVERDCHGLPARELLDEAGVSLGCVAWWQAWAELYGRGLLAPDDEMRAACERYAAETRAK